jgi:hypothetical protein
VVTVEKSTGQMGINFEISYKEPLRSFTRKNTNSKLAHHLSEKG